MNLIGKISVKKGNHHPLSMNTNKDVIGKQNYGHAIRHIV